MNQQYLDHLKASIENGPIQYANMAGIQVETVEERHVKATLPVNPVHLNHVGTVYAGSMFVLAEVLGGSLFLSTYGGEYVPVLKGVEMRYLKPTKKDLVIDLSLTEEEAKAKIEPIAERGRGDYFIDIVVRDVDGVEVYSAKFNYYAFSKEKMTEFAR